MASLVVVNSFGFLHVWKIISLCFKGHFCQVEYSWLEVFYFQYFEYIVPLPCGLQISAEKSAGSLTGVPLFVTSCFSLAAFKILSWSLTFDILITLCLTMGLFGFIFFGTLWVSCQDFLIFYGWMFPQFFIHSSVCGHLDCFFVSAVINNAAMIMRCSYLFDIVFLFPVVIFLEMELLDHMDTTFKCLRKFHTVFHSGLPVYNMGNNFNGGGHEQVNHCWKSPVLIITG